MRIGHAILAEAAGVRQYIAQGDGPRCLHQHTPLARLFRSYPQVSKLRQVFLYRVSKAKFAIVREYRNRHSRDWLTHRRDPKKIIRLQLAACCQIALANCRQVQHSIPVGDQCDSPGNFAAGDKRQKFLRDNRKIVSRQRAAGKRNCDAEKQTE